MAVNPAPSVRTLGDKLYQLARLAPEDVRLIEMLVDNCINYRLEQRAAELVKQLEKPEQES